MVLVGYWPLDEESGGIAADVRNNMDGETGGGVTQGAQGVLGETCYDFDGSGIVNTETGDISGGPLDISERLTLSCWIFSRGTNNNEICVVHHRRREGASGPSLNYTLSVDGRDSDDFVFWYNGTGDWNIIDSGYDVPTNEWHHLAIAVDNTSNPMEVKFFVDGELYSTKTSSNRIENKTAEFHIGNSDGNSRGINGKIQDVRVYNHALTKSEIQYLYSVSERGLHTSDSRSL